MRIMPFNFEGNNKYWNWLTYMRTYEWKNRYEWIIKMLQMNGVNIDEEWKKIECLPYNQHLEYIYNLIRDNGIPLTLKE